MKKTKGKIMDIIFVADFFADQILGGGELNNEELINILIKKGHNVEKINSEYFSPRYIEENKDKKFIIANFAMLKYSKSIYDIEYIIYEHDHKYLTTRNPGVFDNFKAPKSEIINIDLYKNAKAVLCQSVFHTEIVKLNTDLDNLINLGGNIWDLKSLELMKEMSQNNKSESYAIMDSPISHKNTGGAIKYCMVKGYEYKLISSKSYKTFLSLLSQNKSLVFIPKTPETLSRVVVEARMMNMGVVTNKMIGAASEPWYKLKGPELIDIMTEKREEIANIVLRSLE